MADEFKVVAIDVGGTNLRATTIDQDGKLHHRVSQSADVLRDGDPIKVLGDLIADMSSAVGGGVIAAVVGVPSILTKSRRGIVRTPLLTALRGDDLADRLQEHSGMAVFLDHDATLQTRGEAYHGSAIGKDLVLGVYFGTGVGGAFIDHGDLMGGIYRMQIGHMPLRGEGRIGTGGAIDCVEAYASGIVLQSLAADHGIPVNAVFSSDVSPRLKTDLKTFVHDQALTIAMAMTLTDPEIVVIGGGITEMPGYPFGELVRQVNTCLSPVLAQGDRHVVKACLGAAAASWGALGIVQAERQAHRLSPANRVLSAS